MTGRGPSRPLGVVTRGTTNPNRLRRVDRWITASYPGLLRGPADPLATDPLATDPTGRCPLIVDLGFGASPVTTVELRDRLVAAAGHRVRVVGLEIDPVRVAQAQSAAEPPWLEFGRGGFELAGLRPTIVRAMNVLRQYDESAVPAAWATMIRALGEGGVVVEGTCDELGRVASWVTLDADGPHSLTLAARLANLDTPITFAERLPKALIHHNVAGSGVYDLIQALDHAWRSAAQYLPFGARQRWMRAVAAVRSAGWPVLDRPNRWRLGEMTVAWSAVRPVPARPSVARPSVVRPGRPVGS